MKQELREYLEKIALEIVNEVDYDIAKDYCTETAEEPEYAQARLDDIVEILNRLRDDSVAR